MRAWLIALVVAVAVGCGGKKERKPKSYPDGTAEAAFNDMHRKFRASDGKGAWALFSDEMRQAMSLRMASLRSQPARLEAELGASPPNVADLGDEDMYGLLLSGKKMQKKLAAGFPIITGGHELEPGVYRIMYDDPRRGACTQPFIKEGGRWKARRGPACKK